MGKEILIGASKSGSKINMSISEAPRVAILGSTGSGKSVLLQNLVLMLARELRNKVQFLGVDMKLVSCEPLKNRLCTDPIVEPVKVLPMLQQVEQLMMDRQAMMHEKGIEKIEPDSELAEEFPMVVVIAEELVALMNNPEIPSTVNKALRDWFVTYLVRCRASNMGIICASQSYVESLTIPTAARAQLTTRFLMKSSINDVKILAEGMDECCPAHLLSSAGEFYFSDNGNYSVWQKGKTWYTPPDKVRELASTFSIDRRDVGLGWTVENPFE